MPEKLIGYKECGLRNQARCDVGARAATYGFIQPPLAIWLSTFRSRRGDSLGTRSVPLQRRTVARDDRDLPGALIVSPRNALPRDIDANIVVLSRSDNFVGLPFYWNNSLDLAMIIL